MFACVHCASADLAVIAAAFAPVWETVADDTVVFSVRELLRLHESFEAIARAIAQRAGGNAQVAIAPNPDTAIVAARNFEGVRVLDGNAAFALAPLPVDVLALSPEMQATLDSWGIRTLGQLAVLPEKGMAERLGEEAVYARRLARAEVDRPLHIAKAELPYETRVDLEHPLELLEPLMFILGRVFGEFAARLESEGFAANELRIALELGDGSEHSRTIRLPFPMREARTFLKLAQLDLEAHPPQASIQAVRVAVSTVEPRRFQNGLFIPLAPAPDRLEYTLARIRALVGPHNTGVPRLLDTHAPEPFLLDAEATPALAKQHTRGESRIGFRYFRPALRATVQIENGRPARVQAPGVVGKVMIAAGPWRTSGNWWTAHGWTRDEWDLALSDGGLYRAYREPEGGWFIEGSYD